MDIVKSKYIYMINYKEKEKELCDLELRNIFDLSFDSKFIFSDLDYNPSNSVFIKSQMEIMFESNCIDQLSVNIENSKLTLDGYKISYIKNDIIEYHDRLRSMQKIGNSIEGRFDLKTPAHNLAITRINNIWYFGKYKRNGNEWVNRKNKPFNYSIALDVSLAKSLINIASKNNRDVKILDPCCGIGTVVIEGLMMGYDIVGYEINPLIARHANENLRFFKLDEVIINKDMSLITEDYDVAIIDLPYGMYTPTREGLQSDIIKKSREIVNRAVIISKEEIDNIIQFHGFKIEEKAELKKTHTFSRFIYTCK